MCGIQTQLDNFERRITNKVEEVKSPNLARIENELDIHRGEIMEMGSRPYFMTYISHIEEMVEV